ncbi:tyrosine-type recombinase/integrase [uncultured Roseovarius sp.]|uniref:tyrosine-type recombinase/integrase n=1 Tax=uncultured Roseovarius sp. TaxID=293344 RepID=UPI0025F95E09|nr:tyrosine-type recombinase/integrase [uncultured Roseovarius sp.]
MTEDLSKETPVSPFVSAEAPMFDGVIAQLSSMENLPPTRRRDLKSALNTLARIIGRRPSEIPANINWLHVRVRKIVPAQHNITKKRLANIKSDALKALELTGCSRKRSDWLAPVSQDWSDLLGRIENKHDLWKLTQLAQFCSALSVGPQQVRDQHTLDLLKTLIEESFVNRPEHVVANAIRTWNRLKDQVSDWPEVALSRLPRKKEPWTFHIETFPDAFQSDVNAWLERLRNPDLFDASGPSQPLRPTTIAHRRFQIQEVASALVRSGKPMTEITSLALLVEMDNLKAALRWMMGRFNDKPKDAIKGVAVCLQAIANHHVGVDAAHLDDIRGIVKRLGRDADGLREKNRQRLLQLEDSENLAKLLHLPAVLVTKAEHLFATKPRKAALLVQAALAIEILLNCPMRVGNLASLNLERHLKPIKIKREHRTHIHIPSHEVKNNVALDYELGKDATVLLNYYLEKARPVLLVERSDFLFPAMNGGSKRPNGVSTLIKKTILEHTGLTIHAHLFRSIAGKIHSLVQPGDVTTLSHVLNNSLSTAMKAYAQFERRSALEHYQNSLSAVRSAG